MALVAAYVGNALNHPDLYRVMFDASVDLDDRSAADATMEHLVQAVLRAQRDGRVRSDVVPLDLAIQSWAIGHAVSSSSASHAWDVRPAGHTATRDVLRSTSGTTVALRASSATSLVHHWQTGSLQMTV